MCLGATLSMYHVPRTECPGLYAPQRILLQKETSHLFRLVSSQLSGRRLPEAIFLSGLCDLQI